MFLGIISSVEVNGKNGILSFKAQGQHHYLVGAPLEN